MAVDGGRPGAVLHGLGVVLRHLVARGRRAIIGVLPDRCRTTMHSYAFRLLNVFAHATFGGNPLCVFEDARGLGDQTMLDLARQFNLSETTFVLPSAQADAR